MFEDIYGTGITTPEDQNQLDSTPYTQEQERQPTSLESAFNGPDVGNPGKMLPSGGPAPNLPPQVGTTPTMPGASVPMPPPPPGPANAAPQQPGPGPGVPIPPALMGGEPQYSPQNKPFKPIGATSVPTPPLPPEMTAPNRTPLGKWGGEEAVTAPATTGSGRTALPPLPGQKGYTGKPSSPSAGGSSGQPMLPADRVRQASESAGPKEMGPFGIDKARWRAFLSGMGRAMAESSPRGSFFHGLGSGMHYTLGAEDEANKAAGAAEDGKRKRAREDFNDEHTNRKAGLDESRDRRAEEKGVLDAAKQVEKDRRERENDAILNRGRIAQTEKTERENADAKSGRPGGNREVNTGQYNTALDNFKSEEKAAHEAIDGDKTLDPQQKAQLKQQKSDEIFRNQFGPFNEAAVRKSFGSERYDRAFAPRENTGGSQDVGLTPEEARKLPPGTRFIGRNGQPYTR